MLEQLLCKDKLWISPSLSQPPLTTQFLTLSCTAKPHQALCGKRLIGKAPFPHHLGFSFHIANWSIIHLLWQSSALGTKLSGGLDFMAPPAGAGGKVLMYSFVP